MNLKEIKRQLEDLASVRVGEADRAFLTRLQQEVDDRDQLDYDDTDRLRELWESHF